MFYICRTLRFMKLQYYKNVNLQKNRTNVHGFVALTIILCYNNSKIQMLRICRTLRSKILSFTNSAQANKLLCVANL